MHKRKTFQNNISRKKPLIYVWEFFHNNLAKHSLKNWVKTWITYFFLIGKQYELRNLIKDFILQFTISCCKYKFKMACSAERYGLEFELKDHKLKIMVYPHYLNWHFIHLYLLSLLTVTVGTSDKSTTASEKCLVKALRKPQVQLMDWYKVNKMLTLAMETSWEGATIAF